MKQKLAATFLIVLLILSLNISTCIAESTHSGIAGTINVSYDENTSIIVVSGTTIDENSKLSILVTRTNDGFRAQIDAALSDADGNYSFDFPLDNGVYNIVVNSPNERLAVDRLVLPITNGNATNTISPTSANFDKKSSAQADLIVTISGSELASIKRGTVDLIKVTDYTVNGNTVVLKKSYLATLPIGNTNLIIEFLEGDICILIVTVHDTTPEDNDERDNDRSAIIPTPPPVTQILGAFVVQVSAPMLSASTGVAQVSVGSSALSSALTASLADNQGIKNVIIPVTTIQGAKAYEVILPSTYLSGNTEKPTSIIQMQTAFGTIEMPDNMLNTTDLANTDGNIGISIGHADKNNIPEGLKSQIGDSLVFDINLEVNGIKKVWNNPNMPVTISLNYVPTAEELKNPDNIVIWYLDEITNMPVPISNCKYDPSTGKVTFKTTHFSKYAISYVKSRLTDINDYTWAKKEIDAVVAKGILKLETATIFNPKINVTRAEFIYGIVRSLGLTAKVNNNFSDIETTDYYYNEIGIAKALGIAQGIGGNKFVPESAITRQDMIVLTARVLTKLGKLNEVPPADLSRFTDSSIISSYAKESVAKIVGDGIIIGNGNTINPFGNTSRAEAAIVLYRVYNK